MRKLNFIQNLAWIRACLFCGVTYGRTELLCKECEVRTRSRGMFAGRDARFGFHIKSAFVWREGDPLISEIIYSLKGGKRGASAFSCLADMFSLSHLVSESTGRMSLADSKDVLPSGENRLNFTDSRAYVFVPAPAKNFGEQDHAFCWAEALAKIYEGSLCCALQRGDEVGTQKERSREQRELAQMRLVKVIDSFEKVIFCDDVVTTGSTARAAYVALNQPASFEVWSLAYRPKRAEAVLLQN